MLKKHVLPVCLGIMLSMSTVCAGSDSTAVTVESIAEAAAGTANKLPSGGEAGSTGTSAQSNTQADTETALDYLRESLEDSARLLMDDGEDVEDIYSELNWTSVADTFPEKFDLRNRGTVMPVKDQSPWGSCWSFAVTAASETSILNALGMTAESYKEKYGEEMNLSEKHLAWFTAKALPDLSDYPEGEYPYDGSQAGEGLHPLEDTEIEPLDFGGNYYMSAASLASGVGILKEKYAPYTDSEGSNSKTGDWSLPEKDRFAVSYEIKDVNILPSPASYDSDGNYVYRPAATEIIKKELLSGRAVGISFKADHAKPTMTPEEKRASVLNNIPDTSDATEEEKNFYADVRAGIVDTDDLSDEELKELVMFRLRINGMPEDTYDLDSFDHDQLGVILLSDDFGESWETIEAGLHRKVYMSFTGDDPVIWAQYTDERVKSNHAVTVVGWDDTFSAENWPEGRRPPADGVWIVKNSWGEDWGNDGYFLLSYYDMNLCACSSFEYVVTEDEQQMEHLGILEYDYMPSVLISSTLFDKPVYAANVFDIHYDSVLSYVSAMTGDLDTEVTASIYLLDGDAVLPTDGTLLDSVTQSFNFAGYHRIPLSGNLLLHEGSRISVVVTCRVPLGDGSRYALVNNSGISKKGMVAYQKLHPEQKTPLSRYATGVVNPGESFVDLGDGNWMDWTDTVSKIREARRTALMEFDNLPIKAYVYPWDEVEKIHDLSARVPVVGGEAAICPEDGYLLLDVAK